MRQSLKTIIHEEGYFFAFIFLGISVLLWHFHPFLGKIGLLLTAWCLYFFRDPVRQSPGGNTIVAPADGTIIYIKEII